MWYLMLFQWLMADPAHALTPKFEAQLLDSNVAIGYGLAIGDVDGDGKLDILLVDKKEFVWYRNGDWKRFVMVENLTAFDNVCIAAADINGDGQVEVAVGAQWNPGETSDPIKSGSVHYLVRPADPTQKWTPVRLHHEPTVHRMRWAKAGDKYQLIMAPLHGQGNKGGEGAGVHIIAYEVPSDLTGPWTYSVIDDSMHMTHNLDVFPEENGDAVYIGGKEGVKAFQFKNGRWTAHSDGAWLVQGHSFGELRIGTGWDGQKFLTGIEPLHGNLLTTYIPSNGTFKKENLKRSLVTDQLNQGHGLAAVDLLNQGQDQLVVGWREKNTTGKIGIQLYIPNGTKGWDLIWIDEGGMACEDLQVADLNGDGKLDIIASGRATNNLKIYWNKSH
ncbi:FG-GAP repeat domain-containing protein [Lunatimonas salinarum]|uniref:FG-GAP repeat domain-containing protein n=1 Tax=Lunatimonas salinarum TaxID=1774590 RepID=UPI001FD86193|nr:VCBS repeat-containing protein [Lunatimonas salinarum]